MGNSEITAMEPYTVKFTYKGEIYHTTLEVCDLHCIINGVRIEVELDGNLYIEQPDLYGADQLAFFSYDKRYDQRLDSLILADYRFQYCLPVKVFEREGQHAIETCLLGCLEHDGDVRYSWTILGASSSSSDIEYAILELQKQLQQTHFIEICCCCQYGDTNPYGGDPYLNFLCFRKKKGEYMALGGRVNKHDWTFFTDEKNVESTTPLDHCSDFLFRESLLKPPSGR